MLRGLEDRQVFGIDEDLDASGLAWFVADQAPALKGQHHLVTDGGLTRKWRCTSGSAGGRPFTRVQASMKARYCPCLSVKRLLEEDIARAIDSSGPP